METLALLIGRFYLAMPTIHLVILSVSAVFWIVLSIADAIKARRFRRRYPTEEERYAARQRIRDEERRKAMARLEYDPNESDAQRWKKCPYR